MYDITQTRGLGWPGNWARDAPYGPLIAPFRAGRTSIRHLVMCIDQTLLLTTVKAESVHNSIYEEIHVF